MRNLLIIASLFATAAGCAVRQPISTIPREYACGEVALVPHGTQLEIRDRVASLAGSASNGARLGWHDDAGDHYVAWPVAPGDLETTEYVVPRDPARDASERTYDTTTGTQRADWRLLHAETCTVRGGYSDVVIRFVKGASYEDLARDLGLGDRAAARDLVHGRMNEMQVSYYRK